jgi:hypothetical protein
LDVVGLAPSRLRAAALAWSIRLGFLGSWPFRCEGPRSGALDFLGFPWILSFESRLFNGLRGFSPEEYFSRLFSVVLEAQGREPAVLGHAEARDCSWAQA